MADTPTLYFMLLNDLVDWIEEHINDGLTLDMVAKKSGYTKWHLQRIFLEFTGIPLGVYLRRRRLTKLYFEIMRNNGQEPLCKLPGYSSYAAKSTISRTFFSQFGFMPKESLSVSPRNDALQLKLELKPEMFLIKPDKLFKPKAKKKPA